MPDQDWNRLAQLVVTRRTELGMKTTTALAKRMDMSTRVLSDIENARRDSYDRGTLAQLEQALAWSPGSVRQILEGADVQVSAPVGSGVDPATLQELADLSPDEVQRVVDFVRGLKAGRT